MRPRPDRRQLLSLSLSAFIFTFQFSAESSSSRHRCCSALEATSGPTPTWICETNEWRERKKAEIYQEHTNRISIRTTDVYINIYDCIVCDERVDFNNFPHTIDRDAQWNAVFGKLAFSSDLCADDIRVGQFEPSANSIRNCSLLPVRAGVGWQTRTGKYP